MLEQPPHVVPRVLKSASRWPPWKSTGSGPRRRAVGPRPFDDLADSPYGHLEQRGRERPHVSLPGSSPAARWRTERLAAVELQLGQYPGARQEVARSNLSVLVAAVAVKDRQAELVATSSWSATLCRKAKGSPAWSQWRLTDESPQGFLGRDKAGESVGAVQLPPNCLSIPNG